MPDDGGLSKVQARLAAIPDAIKADIQRSLQKSGEELVAEMRQLAPRQTGALKASIVMTPAGQSPPVRSISSGKTVADNAIVISAGNIRAFYARWQEFGTKHAIARSFFYVIWRLRRVRVKRRLARDTKASLARYIAKNFANG